MAIQMAMVILIGTYFGSFLDKHFNNNIPILTVVFSLFSIFSSLYYFLRDLIKKNDS